MPSRANLISSHFKPLHECAVSLSLGPWLLGSWQWQVGEYLGYLPILDLDYLFRFWSLTLISMTLYFFPGNPGL